MKRMFGVASAALAVAVSARTASAAETVWTGNGSGSGGNTLWTSVANWTSNPALPPSGNDLRFGTGFSSGLNIDPVDNRALGTLFVDTTAAFNIRNALADRTLTLNGGNITRTSASSNTQTIGANLFLAAQGSFNIAGSGGLTLGGVNAIAGNPRGTITAAAGVGIQKDNAGLLTLAGPINVDHLRLNDGSVRVDGAAVTLTSTTLDANTAVILDNNTSLTVQNGGVVDTGPAGSAVFSGSTTQSVTVTGNGSRFDVGNNLWVGNSAAGTLVVDNQGAVSSDNNISVGLSSGGLGNMRIQGGGTATAATVTVGTLTGATGSVVVTGANSHLAAGLLALGGLSSNQFGGTSSLTVSDGGTVEAGQLDLWTASTSITVNGGTLKTGKITTPAGAAVTINLAADPPGGGSALIISPQSGTTDVAVNLIGPGSLTKSGNSQVTLVGAVNHTGSTIIEQGTLILPNGLGPGGPLVVNNSSLIAGGVVNRRLSGNGTLTPNGAVLAIGDLTRTDGVDFGGLLIVMNASVLLLDADRATLSGGVSLSNGGRLNSFAGITSSATVSGGITANSTIDGAFTNNGEVNGPIVAGRALTFTGDVNGIGSYTGNVVFSDGFSPGNSPANVSLQNMTFDGTTDLMMELGGKTAGSEYDRLTVSGAGTLAGTLDVTLINGFAPSLGDTFLLIDGGTLTGSFATTHLPTLPAGEQWLVTQTASDYSLTVVPEPALGTASLTALAAMFSRRLRRRHA